MFKQIPFTADKSHSYIPLIINPYPQLYPSPYHSYITNNIPGPQGCFIGGVPIKYHIIQPWFITPGFTLIYH